MTERRYIVTGQRVSGEKVEVARRLRRDSTPSETLLWAELRGRRLGGYKFRRQQLVAGFVPDFYCAEASLCVELDGPVQDSQAEADAERDDVLRGRGLRMMRIENRRVESGVAAVLAEIEATCRTGAGGES